MIVCASSRTRKSEDRSDELVRLICTMEIGSLQDPSVHYLYEARDRYPQAVAKGLLARLRSGRTLFQGADDLLASAGLALEDDELTDLALADPVSQWLSRRRGRVGPRAKAAGRLVDAFLNLGRVAPVW